SLLHFDSIRFCLHRDYSLNAIHLDECCLGNDTTPQTGSLDKNYRKFDRTVWNYTSHELTQTRYSALLERIALRTWSCFILHDKSSRFESRGETSQQHST